LSRNKNFHGPANYANQQLSLAIRILAVGAGDIRQRLVQAYYQFHPLTPQHFPEHLREDFAWVMSQLTRYAPEIDFEGKVQKGAVEKTCQMIRRSTGVKIAERLLFLHDAVDEYVRQHGVR
jgi:hypothetical protein